MKLDNGALAESLLKKAGPQLQEECKNKYPNGIKSGEVAVTGGYSLKATKVYHGTIPKYEKGYNAKKVKVLLNTAYVRVLHHMLLISINEALPGVLGNRGTRAFVSGEQGNKGQILRGTGEQRQYWGTGIIENKFLFLGNRRTSRFILGEQGNRYPLGGPH